MLGGLDAPDSGEVAVAGERLAGRRSGALSRIRLRHIGFVFQQFQLIEELSGIENVLLAARLPGAPTVDPTFTGYDANGNEVYNQYPFAYLLLAPGFVPVPRLLSRLLEGSFGIAAAVLLVIIARTSMTEADREPIAGDDGPPGSPDGGGDVGSSPGLDRLSSV